MDGLVDPGFEFARGSHETDLRLLGFEVGVEEGDKFLALGDACGLLVLGSHLRSGEIAAAGFQLDEEDVELLLGELLVESGDLGAGGELVGGVTGAEAGVKELVADAVGFMFGVGCIGGGFALAGLMSFVVKGDGDLDSDGGVVLLEAKVVVLKVIELGVAAVLRVEDDLRSPEIAGFAEGSLAFGACDGVGGVDCRAGEEGGGGKIRGAGRRWKGGEAIAGDDEASRRKTDEAREMSLVSDGFVFGAKPGETDLRGGEAGGCEVDWGVLAGVETLLNDGDEAVCEALLLLESGLTLRVAVDREVGDGGVFGYALADVFEAEFGCIERGLGGAEVVALRVAED